MPMFVKISKRIKDKLHMITPGVRDNSILPSSGGASNSGITLDYSAINIGGVDNGIPYNKIDDDFITLKNLPVLQQLKAVKAPDFHETGIYLVETPNGIKRIYRDPENREWYEDTHKHFSESWLGSTKQEALDRLDRMYNNVIEVNEADDITVYHGSHNKFDVFDLGKSRVGEIGKAIYFSENSAVSKSYGNNLIELTISPKKPLDFFNMSEAEAIALGKRTGVPADFLKESIDLYANYGTAQWAMCWWNLSIAGLEVSYGDAATREILAKFLQKNGYDAVCFPFHSDNSRTWAVFDPSIITIKKDNETKANNADDEDEGEKYRADELTSNWWVADHRIKLNNKLWEKATALLWPWVNKVQLSRLKQKDDGSWEEVHKIVDADDILILLPLENHAANDLYYVNRETPSSSTKFPTETANNSYIGRSEEGFNFRHNLDYGSTANYKLAGNFVNLPQYSDPNMYQQILNPRNKATEPLIAYDIAETYFLDDNDQLISLNKLKNILPNLAHAAQQIYDSWIQDEDDELNGGGICHLIAEAFCDEMNKIGIECSTVSYSIGEVHVAAVAKLKEGVFTIDIHPSYYETGGGYSWTKRPDIIFSPDMISIEQNDNDPNEFENYIGDSANDIIEYREKKAFPDYPIYNNEPMMYEMVNEKPDANTTQHFDSWNTYYADDNFNPFKRPLNKRRWNETIDAGVAWIKMMEEWPYLMASETTDADINEWIEALKWRLGIPPKYNKEIKDIIKYQRDRVQNSNFADRDNKIYGELILLLRQYAYTDPDWLDKNQFINEDWNDIDVTEGEFNKQAFIKTAVTYDSHPVIQELLKIPQVKSLLDQQASGFVDKVIVTTPGADIAQTQQQMQQSNGQPTQLQQISGNPYGHVWISEDPTTHQKKPLDKIVRIDRVTDQWGTLNTILHEIAHHRHPDWSEAQVESEAQRNADSVKQFLGKQANTKRIMFVKNNLREFPLIECEIADTYQKQVIGLQNHTKLNHKSGMWFPYKNAQSLSFWMGKVSFPIDIIFANDMGKILKIYRNCQPNSTELYTCADASNVIEVVGSFCAFHDLDVGDHIFEANDDAFKREDFAKYIIQLLKEYKLKQQDELNMNNWNIKLVMKYEPDSRKFLKVNWTSKDYQLKKAEIFVNPDPLLISAALKKMSLDKLIRHALLHILAGAKHELPEDKEKELITNKL